MPEPETVRQAVAVTYANLARADMALSEGATKYKRLHHMVRAKLYRGLVSGDMSMKSLYHDERLKMTKASVCYYCASDRNLCVDHLIPRFRGGPDHADNLVWACKKCNSSKGKKDMLAWSVEKGNFPPILLLRRYMKIVSRYCEDHGIMDDALASVDASALPFDIHALPPKFPPLGELRLWAEAEPAPPPDSPSAA